MTVVYYFEDFAVGDSQQSISYKVEKEEVIEFASKWDPQPWHIDEVAAKQSMFGGLTACSAHIFSIFCLISPQWESGVTQKALASLGFDQLKMHLPLFVGDTVYNVSTVEVARPSSSKSDRGIIVCHCELINQRGDVVFSLSSSFLVARRSVTK